MLLLPNSRLVRSPTRAVFSTYDQPNWVFKLFKSILLVAELRAILSRCVEGALYNE